MKHLVFDTETTNLISNSLQPLSKQPRIIEVFGLQLNDEDWSERRTIHSYIDPEMPIPEEVTKITGITQEHVRGKPTFRAFFPLLAEVIQGSDVVVAHNLAYDMAVVDFECLRLGKKMAWPKRRVCTVEATECIKGYRLNLTALHTELFGEAFAKAHSAEQDVRATARCYIELKSRGEI